MSLFSFGPVIVKKDQYFKNRSTVILKHSKTDKGHRTVTQSSYPADKNFINNSSKNMKPKNYTFLSGALHMTS